VTLEVFDPIRRQPLKVDVVVMDVRAGRVFFAVAPRHGSIDDMRQDNPAAKPTHSISSPRTSNSMVCADTSKRM